MVVPRCGRTGEDRRADADGPVVRRDDDAGAGDASVFSRARRSRTSASPRSATASPGRGAAKARRVRVRARPSGCRRTCTGSTTSRTGASRASCGGGHRIPAWYDEAGNVYVARDEAGGAAQARAKLGREPASFAQDDGRARHVVLVGAVVPLDARLAGGHDASCARSCRRRCWSRASTSSSSGSRG